MTLQSFVGRVYSKLIIAYYRKRKSIMIGVQTNVRKSFVLRVANGGVIVIGDNCFFNYNCSATSFLSITVGDNCIFGENVKIYDHNHVFNKKNTLIKDSGFRTDRVCIGNNVWVGSNVTILKGTVVGDNCVIAAGCVLNNVNIPANTIVKNNASFTMEEIKFDV